MKQKIWIDVTDFLKWRGNFTGFQHIQYHIAKLYLAGGRDVAFFVYDQPARAFRQVAFDPDEVSANGIRSAETSRPSRSLMSMAKRLAPGPVKKVAKRILSSRQSSPAVTTQSPFTKDDTVVVLGGIWHGTFAADMAQEKHEQHFKFVHVVHDMIPVVCPQYVVEGLPQVFAAYKDTIFRIADGLIINSESSKRDALAFMNERGIKPPKSVVFRLADVRPSDVASEAVSGLKPGQFLLSLGTVEGRKNHMLLYYAYKQAAREGAKLPKMVIAGRRGWLIDDLLYLLERDPQIKDQFIILDGVTNSQRAWLFEHCLLKIWPSFYEGWGMPVAEALTYGKVCLSSDASAMPEIGGALTDYFSPYSPEECLRLIQKYLDPKTREARERQIKKQYKPTTWDDMHTAISGFIDTI